MPPKAVMGGIFMLVIATALAGCGVSPPTVFITLAPLSKPSRVTGYTGAPVVVGRVRLPPELDRLALVRYQSSTRLSVDSQIQWAAALPDLVRETLAQDLARQLPPGKVVFPGELRMPQDRRVLTVVFERFAVGPGASVELRAHWRIVDPGGRHTLVEHGQQIREVLRSSSGPAAAQAISRALARLAAEIAGQMR